MVAATKAMRSIRDLMQVAPPKRDLSWLQDSLQNAVELELSTLPPYLCGLWSIQDGGKGQNGAVAHDLIQSIVYQEMFHMGLACNMLTALGRVPGILSGYQDHIKYPGPLPGDVRPQLTVYLAGLTTQYISDVYMQIEYPENGPIALDVGESFSTIGAFYDAVLDCFMKLKPSLSATNQLTSKIKKDQVNVITTLDQVQQAITTIKEQGEGTSKSPDFQRDNLAHYYKFAEIYHGHQLIQDPVSKAWTYTGPAIPFPTAYPMAQIPAGGYVNPAPDVQAALNTFNGTFTSLLTNLQNAWAQGSEGLLNTAVGNMFDLEGQADAIFAFELPSGQGVYGPNFLVVPLP